MAHYALLDANNIVVNVIVGKDESDATLDWEQHYAAVSGLGCKRTSYNTHGNQHIAGGTPFRKNYASVGFVYDEARDAFIAPKPFQSWVLNEDTCLWEPPTKPPEDGKNYRWDESTLSWMELQ